MDTISVIATLMCAILILFSKVEVFTTAKYYGLYGAVWYFVFSMLISAGIAWMA